MANKKVSQLTSKPAVNLTDLFLIADPTSGQAFKTTISNLGTAIGSGVSSVNGLVGAVVLDTDDIQELASPTNRWFTDTRARAALTAASPLAYNSGTGVFSIPQADGSTNGFLSSADWTTFNAKQAALSGTGFVKISGTTISYDNSTYLTTSAAASTYLALAGGTLTGALNGTSATFTGDLTLSATNPRLYFTDTDNNPDYFISNTDGTFTVYDVTNSTSRFTIGTTGNGTFGGNLTVGQIIRSGGTSSQFLKADGSVDSTSYQPTLTNPVTGTGTSGIVAKFSGTSAITDSIIYDNGTRVSIGANVTTSNTFTSVSSTTSAYAVVAQASSAANGIWSNVLGTGEIFRGQTAGGSYFIINNGGNAFLNGNLNVGDFASTSYRLNVVGTANFTGALSGTSATFSGDLTLGSSATPFIGNNIYLRGRNIANSAYKAMIGIGGSGSIAPDKVLIDPDNNGSHFGGAATFSSSVTASGAKSQFVADGGAGSGAGIALNTGLSGTDRRNWFIGTEENVAGDFVIKSSNAAGGSGNAGTTRIQINNNGNVGIGTTAPNINGGAGYGTTLTILASSNYGGLEVYGAGSTNGGQLDFGSGSVRYASISGEYESSDNGFINIRTRRAGTMTNAVRITSSGNVGIGTTSPLNATGYTSISLNNATNGGILDYQQNGTSVMRVGNNGTTVAFIETRTATPLTFSTNDTERMRITSAGNVGIGTTGSSSIRLIVCGQDGGSSNFSLVGADNLGNTRFSVRNDGLTSMLTAYSDRYRLNDTGGGFVTLEMENSARWRINYLGRFSGYGAGTLTTDASGNISASSDRTLKDVIKPIENVLENIKDFEPVYFKWNDKTDLDKENVYMSTIAQSIQKHYPDAVGKMADGTLTVQDRAVTAILVQAIKELKAELDTLKNK